MNLIDSALNEQGHIIYNLKAVKNQMQNLPNGFQTMPYEYFLLKYNEKKKREEKARWYDTENARLQYQNYPTTKWMAKAAFYIS